MNPSKHSISRVKRSRADAKASYDMMSRWYDLFAGSFERKYCMAGLDLLDVKSGERVLEIGFGTGHAIIALAHSVGSSGQVFGIDISEGMYNITQARIQDEGMTRRVTLSCADALNLLYENHFFDAVFMSFTLELFDTPDIPILLSECKRVLRTNGRIGVVSLTKSEHPSFITRMYEWLHDRFPKWLDCRPIRPQEELAEVGFSVVQSYQMPMYGLIVELVLARKPREEQNFG